MNKDNPKVTLTIASIVVGILLAFLIRSNMKIYVPVTNESIEKTRDEIRVLKDEVEQLKTVADERERQLENLQDKLHNEEEVDNILADELDYRKLKAGHKKLEGPGISIKMYDNIDTTSANVNDDVIHDIDILNILNDLRIAGAEAISINDERVVSTSEIKCGGPIIRINKISIGTPFVVKAIGDPKLLMASVNAPGTYGDVLKNVYRIGFEPKVEDNLVIPAYTGNFAFKYAKPKEGGE